MMTRKTAVHVAGLLLFMAAACSGSKAPASKAIAAAQAAYDAVKGDAQKYVPEKAQTVEEMLTSARTSFDKGDYDAALKAANTAIPAVNDLSAASAAKKEELTRIWADLSNGIPKMVNAIQSRVNHLSRSKALPEGMDATEFEGARSGLIDLIRMWSDATIAYKSGNIPSAVTTANMVKDQAVRIMSNLGMQIPIAAGN